MFVYGGAAQVCGPASGVNSLVYRGCTLLRIVDHFNVSLKFNSGSIRRIYSVGRISYGAFLVIIGFLNRRDGRVRSRLRKLSVPTLMRCLGGTRSCFLSFRLPAVQQGLVRTVSYSSRGRITFLVIGFFSTCIRRMHGRVRCRGRGMFACIRRLLGKRQLGSCDVKIFTHRRSRVGTGLARLGGVVVGCCPSNKSGRLLGTALFSVFDYRRSLTSRGQIRSFVFIPTVVRLRGRVG